MNKPFNTGVVSDAFGTQLSAMAIIVVIWSYMIWLIKSIVKQ